MFGIDEIDDSRNELIIVLLYLYQVVRTILRK